MPARRVTRREAEAFLSRLEGREGADRERLVREHREYIDGTRDHDADFGDEEQKEDATTAPHTPTRLPRMTVTASNSSAPRHQKNRALSMFYDMLAKTPVLRGKMPVAALNAEELAEQAAIVESELDDDRMRATTTRLKRCRMMMPITWRQRRRRQLPAVTPLRSGGRRRKQYRSKRRKPQGKRSESGQL
ncbi:hypothetical protein PR003_g28629 [Phytophthora rubi]|uniref:Uncharacterized protein n=1 Tax=Phytophthora rubi TaxID=129364 RepID=A0A6A3HIM2_9STRA|nr:hypothetical protein PR002_g27232 [Phytophthora rubi]KAE9278057.1 hypothetical protein PR003_g28629 [Phytophthora rubi]